MASGFVTDLDRHYGYDPRLRSRATKSDFWAKRSPVVGRLRERDKRRSGVEAWTRLLCAQTASKAKSHRSKGEEFEMSEQANAPRVWMRWALALALATGTVAGSIV